MSTSELEERMKDLLAGQSYKPDDEAWAKMQTALQPPAGRRLLLLFPAWKAAAAITGLVLLSGGAGYFLYKNEQHSKDNGLAVAPAQHIPAGRPDVNIATPSAETEQVAAASFGHKRSAPAGTPAAALPGNPGTSGKTITPAQDPQAATQTAQQSVALQQPANGRPSDYFTDEGIYAPEPFSLNKKQPRKVPGVGIAANVGKPNLGDVQYNVGLVLRQDIAGPLFAEASVSLASTNVHYAENAYGYIPNEITNSYAESMGKSEEITMRYTNNIISVGFAPSIGVKATSDLSVSVGGDVYRSLNNALAVQNRSDLNKYAQTTAVTDKQQITNWDAGLKAQVDYRIGPHVSFSTQYRHGLTQFILVDKQSLKNSSFNVGVRYNIGR